MKVSERVVSVMAQAFPNLRPESSIVDNALVVKCWNNKGEYVGVNVSRDINGLSFSVISKSNDYGLDTISIKRVDANPATSGTGINAVDVQDAILKCVCHINTMQYL